MYAPPQHLPDPPPPSTHRRLSAAPPSAPFSAMTTDAQQVFVSIVSQYLAGMPVVRWGRCDGLAALRFACAARNPQRHQLSAWGWRQLCRCEVETVRLGGVRMGRVTEWLEHVSTLLRSSTDAGQGSLLTRLKYTISQTAILEGVIRNSRSRVTPAAIREWVAGQVDLGHFWWGVHNLADDQQVPVAGEFDFTDSSEEEG